MDVLVASVNPENRPPPDIMSPVFAHRNLVLKRLLPDKDHDALRRRFGIMRLTHGADLTSEQITWCTRAAKPKILQWAKDLAELILPRPTAVFQRNRWLNDQRHVLGVALFLNFYNLGARVIPRWLQYLQNRKVDSLVVDHVGWELDDDDGDADEDEWKEAELLGENGVRRRPVAPPKDADPSFFAEYNKQNRQGVRALVRLPCAELLLVASLTIDPQLHLLHSEEKIEATDFIEKQLAENAKDDGAVETPGRVQEYSKCNIEAAYFKDIRKAFNDEVLV